jgi:hypothetical protein
MTGVRLELLWIPLGADGSRVVRASGRLYERIRAAREHRSRRDLYHAALRLRADDGTTYAIEVGPAWGRTEPDRGVVRTGPVGAHVLGRLALFRYEVRCWPGGEIPDAHAAVDGPHEVTTDRSRAALLLARTVEVPVPVWGRKAPGTTEMWNSNSVVSWLLSSSGHDLPELPSGGRAPGWRAGVQLALPVSLPVSQVPGQPGPRTLSSRANRS